MKEITKEGCKAIEAVLVNAAKYGGNQEPGRKQLSASQLGNDDLQIYLKFKHGGKDSTQFEANTFGSIYHLGAEQAFKDHPDYRTELPLIWPLDNGWLISGSIDLVDHKHQMLIDHKTTTATSIASTIKEGKNSGYGLQMAVYQWLLYKNQERKYSAVLAMVDKGFSYFKKNKYNQLTFIEIDTHSLEDTEALLYEKTNRLQEYIDLDQEPGECKNLFWYAPKGQKRKPMRCLYYCDQSDNCSHFKNSYASQHSAMQDLMGL